MNLSRIRSRVLLSCIPLLLAATPAQAQRQGQVPEYVGQVNAVAGGASMPLERQNAQTDLKIRGLGFGGGRMRQIVSGDRSPVRFRQGQDIKFVVRVPNQDMDPVSTLRLLPLRVRKGRRELDMMSTGFAGITGARDRVNEHSIAIQAQKLGKNAFTISTVQPLSKGEYALVTADSQALNLFAID
jgi:hypothetical protein